MIPQLYEDSITVQLRDKTLWEQSGTTCK